MKGIQLLFILYILILYPTRTKACTCAPTSDLDRYEYIALVEITGVIKSDLYTPVNYDAFVMSSNQIPPPAPPPPPRRLYEIKVKTIDSYKGEDQDYVIVLGGNEKYNLGITSCDLSLEIGQKWILFGFEYKGRIATGYCTLSKMYENEYRESDYQYNRASDLIDILDKKYNRKKKAVNEGIQTLKYINGKTKLEECYEDQKLQGERLAYYSNGQIQLREFYNDGLKEGSVAWFFRNGELKKQSQYMSDKRVCEEYYYSSTGKLKSINFYDDNGKFIVEERY